MEDNDNHAKSEHDQSRPNVQNSKSLVPARSVAPMIRLEIETLRSEIIRNKKDMYLYPVSKQALRYLLHCYDKCN